MKEELKCLMLKTKIAFFRVMYSSTGPIRSKTGSNASKSCNSTEMRSQTSVEDHQEEESEDNYDLYQSFTDQLINQLPNQSSNRSSEHRSNSNSEKDFYSHFNVDEIGEGELTQILQDEDKTITEDQVTSAASQEKEQSIETKDAKRIKTRIKDPR